MYDDTWTEKWVGFPNFKSLTNHKTEIMTQELENVKVSICPNCNNWVRVAQPKHLETNTKARNEFKNEVFKHNLRVEEMTLLEFKTKAWKICSCE